MMRKVLVTGATGALGIPLVRHLRAEGFAVLILVRPHKYGEKELEEMFGFLPGVIEGDVTVNLCGVNMRQIEALTGKVDVIIHAAGRVQYYDELRAETYLVNETGTRNCLELASLLEVGRFVYVSTAYVGGCQAYLDEDEVGQRKYAYNPYESSKQAAEELVRNWAGGEATIVRPSTIIGHSSTGNLSGIGGYAALVKGLWVLLHLFVERYKNSPFWLNINPYSTLNLVPSDWVVESIVKIIESNKTGTFHLTHPKPVTLAWLFDVTQRRLRLPMVFERQIAEVNARYDDSRWRKVQENLSELIWYFGPYVTHDTTYGHHKITEIPGYAPPPEIDRQLMETQLAYMEAHVFRKKRTVEKVAA